MIHTIDSGIYYRRYTNDDINKHDSNSNKKGKGTQTMFDKGKEVMVDEGEF